jgi:hypothetical protein
MDPTHFPSLPKQVLEINVNHPLIKKLDLLRVEKPQFAQQVAEQVSIVHTL